MHIICSVTGKHISSPELSLNKGALLLETAVEHKIEFNSVALAKHSGIYECGVSMNNIYKANYANLTVKGEKTPWEHITVFVSKHKTH